MLTTKIEIENWLKKMNIKEYIIREDLTVDVYDDFGVYLMKKDLTEIPIQFGLVTSDFYCNENFLTSLKGSPREVIGSFYCNDNQLKDLTGSPNSIHSSFYCDNNQITSLKGISKHIGGVLYAQSNPIKELNIMELPFSISEPLYFAHADIKIKYFENFYNSQNKMKIKLDEIIYYLKKVSLKEKLEISLNQHTKVIKKLKI